MSDGTDLFALVTGAEASAEVEQVSTETVPAPEVDPSLSAQQATNEPVVETAPANTATVPAAPVAAQETPPAPAEINWDDPRLKPLVEQANALNQLRQQAEQLRRQRESEGFVNELKELADDDPERLQRMQQVIAKVATPLTQQRDQLFQRANQTEKMLAALWIAAKAVLPEDQLTALMAETEDAMQVEGAENMEKRITGKRAYQQAQAAALAAKDAEIEELRRQLAARNELGERQATGADLVDGGGGSIPISGDIDDQLRAAKNMDEYFAILTRAA